MRYRTILAIALVLGACSDNPTDTPDPEPGALAVIAGAGQADTVTHELEPVTVRVLEDPEAAAGLAFAIVQDTTVDYPLGLPGQLVCVAADAAAGEPFVPCLTSNAEGDVHVIWTLGTKAGTFDVQVRAMVDQVPVVHGEFDVIAQPGPIDSLRFMLSDTLLWLGEQLALGQRVRVADQYGNAIDTAAAFVAPAAWTVDGGMLTADAEAAGYVRAEIGARADSARVLALANLSASGWRQTALCRNGGVATRSTDGEVLNYDSTAVSMTSPAPTYTHVSGDSAVVRFNFAGELVRFWEDGATDTLATSATLEARQTPDSLVLRGGLNPAVLAGTSPRRYVGPACSGTERVIEELP